MTDRRSFLVKFGGTAGIGSLTGLTGCTALLGQDPVTVGYEPSFRTAQAPVMARKGYLDELDASVEAKNFRDADRSDVTVEVDFTDAISMLFAYSNDTVRGKVVAANNRNGCALLAGEAFARTWDDYGPDAFTRFRERNKEPFTLGAAVYRAHVWFDAVGVPREQVNVDYNVNGGVLPDRIRNGRFDGVFQSEPTLTKLAHADVGLEEVAWTGNATSNLPGGVMVVQDEFREDRPEVVKELLEKHVEATEVLNERPDEAASIVSDAFGDELSTSLARAILEKKTANFVTDPRLITEELNALAHSMFEHGPLAEPVSADDVIEPSLYADVA